MTKVAGKKKSQANGGGRGQQMTKPKRKMATILDTEGKLMIAVAWQI